MVLTLENLGTTIRQRGTVNVRTHPHRFRRNNSTGTMTRHRRTTTVCPHRLLHLNRTYHRPNPRNKTVNMRLTTLLLQFLTITKPCSLTVRVRYGNHVTLFYRRLNATRFVLIRTVPIISGRRRKLIVTGALIRDRVTLMKLTFSNVRRQLNSGTHLNCPNRARNRN